MRPSDRMNDYLDQICGQVRWKKAHSVIRKELQDHLQDQAQAFEDAGNAPEKAAEMAVREMGDPVMLGTQFDRCYRPGIDLPILLTTLVLIALGLIARMMMYSCTGNQSSGWNIAASLLISAGIVLTVLKIDYTALTKTRLIYAGYVLGSILFFAARFKWILQPYYLIAAVPLALCALLYRYRSGGILQLLICYILTAAPLLLFQSSFGVVYLCLISCGIILFAAIRAGIFPSLHFRMFGGIFLLVVPIVVPIVMLIVLRPDIVRNLLASLFPMRDPYGYGYMTQTVRTALSQAKWIGPMENFSELLLPTSGVDYLLTWLICRFGWISFAAVTALAAVAAVFGVRTYRRQSGLLAKLTVCAVFTVWGMQAVTALLVNFGVIYVFSYPFPFFGGNVALIFNAVLLGLLLSVCQMGPLGNAIAADPSRRVSRFRVHFDRETKGLDIKIRW